MIAVQVTGELRFRTAFAPIIHIHNYDCPGFFSNIKKLKERRESAASFHLNSRGYCTLLLLVEVKQEREIHLQ